MISTDKHTETDSDDIDLMDDLATDDLVDQSDFDDNEDGIFASVEPQKKKSGVLAGGLVILCLLSGAAFYFYNKNSEVLSLPANTAPVLASIPEINQEPIVPSMASDFEALPDTKETDPVTLDQPPTQNEPTAELIQENTVPLIQGDTKSVVASAENQASVPDAISLASDPVSASSEANISTSQAPEEIKPEITKIEHDKIPDAQIVKGENAPIPPAQDSLKPAIKEEAVELPPVKNELEAARETINLSKKEKVKSPEATVYFDAPKGKALSDIPPPSINTEVEPGQSIIIVHKGQLNREGMIVERGEDNRLIESGLVKASRASSLGSYDAALNFYNELYRKNPSDPRIAMGRAVTLQKLGESQKAIDGYKAVLDVEPDNPEAITNLMGLIGKTQPAVAIQNLLDLKEKFPRSAAVSAQLGLAYAQSGNSQDGLKQLNAAAVMDPENPLHFFNMAVIYDRLKDRENAIKYYEQALDVYSVNGKSGDFSREQVYDRLATLRGN